MSVTWDLADSRSVLAEFLDRTLPNRHKVVGAWMAQVRAGGRAPVEVEGKYRSDVGTAIELRIALDLAERPVHRASLAMLEQSRCEQLLSAAGFEAPEPMFQEAATTDPMLRAWNRTMRPDLAAGSGQAEALLACYDMAHADTLVRQDRGWSVEELRNGFQWMFAPYMHQHHGKVRDGLNQAWKAYVDRGRDQILGLGNRILIAPEIAGNYGVADLIAGSTLVDIKVYAEPEAHLEQWLDQVLAYALLDRYDFLRVERLAVYLGWQAMTLEVGLHELIADGAQDPVGVLHRLRSQLMAELREDLEFARARREASRFGISLSRRRVDRR